MLMIALDFGRVYLGYVNLQNLSRIAANFAANDPDAWQASPNATTQARYRDIVLNDARATNCDLPGNPDVVAAPTFEDRNGDGDTRDLGDLARVQLTCSFTLITPLISGIVGNPLAVSADAVFPIKNGLAQTAVAPGGSSSTGGLPPTVAFSASPVSGEAPLVVQFNDESGGSPTTWQWDFGDGSFSGVQDPAYTYTAPGTYDVTLTAGNGYGTGTLTKTTYVTVGVPPSNSVAFTADKTGGTAPLTVQFTDQSTETPTAWLWAFGDGATATTQNPSHQYTATGTYDVTLTITTATGDQTLTKTGYISVAVGLCTVPNFVNTKWNDADETWAAAGFSGALTKAPDAKSGNFTIKIQSLTGNSDVPCSSPIELDD